MNSGKDIPACFHRSVVHASAILAVLFAAWGGARSDPPKAITQYNHEVWRTEQGLPQDTVQAIVQTRDGYLWLGTEEGLARFDGVRFVVFDKRNTPALKSNTISALLEDKERNLWIGTNGGGLTRFSQGTFVTYTTKEGLSSDAVVALWEDHEGKLWIGTDGGGLSRFHNGRFEVYGTKDGLSNDTVFAISEDESGSLWIGTHGGLNRLQGGRFINYKTTDGLPSDVVRSTYWDREGNVWIGTTGGGLTRLRDGHFRTYTTKDGLSSNDILSLYEDHSGSLWIGTGGGGLDRLRDGKFSSFSTKEGLSGDDVLAIREDREGGLWIGTSGAGVNRLGDSSFTAYTSREGLPSDVVTPIFEDHAGNVWIGTTAGFSKFIGGRFYTYTTKNGLSNNLVFSICEDGEGGLWIGTRSGLNRFKDGKFKIFTTKDGLPGNTVMVIYADRQGTIWAGTRGGLSRFAAGRFVTYTTKNGLSNDHVLSITEDREGALWIGTDGGGLNSYKDGKFTTYASRDGLSNNVVWTLYEDTGGALWIGTNGGGLNRFKDGRFVVYRSEDGLFDDTVFRILEDDHGNLWMSSNKGIWQVSKRQLQDVAEGKARSIKERSYGTSDGMKSRECNGGFQPAGWKTRDGRLWFPTEKGFVVVDPERLRTGSLPPPVEIEQVFIDNKSFSPRSTARAEPGRGELEFDFTAPSFIAPDKIRFKYQLAGFDKTWIDAGTRRQAYYTNIPPGEYDFRVIAANADDVWNELGASVPLVLRPHFYQTYYFYGMGLVLLLLAGVEADRLRIRHLKARELELRKHNEELERHVVERTIQLEGVNKELEAELSARRHFEETLEQKNVELEDANRAKDNFLASMSHELRTPLNAIIGFTGTLLMKLPGPLTQEQTKQLQTVQKSARHLLSLINDLLDLAKIGSGKVTLNMELIVFQSIVEEVRSTLRPLAEQKGLRLNATVPEEQVLVSTDRRALSQIVLNLMSNAIKFTDQGEVDIVLSREQLDGRTWVQLSVHDTGIGIRPEDGSKLFRAFSRLERTARRHEGTGLGLQLSQKLAELLGGQITFKSEYGKGSTFTLHLPDTGDGVLLPEQRTA
jgi:signal transduction histidine kinase/ligand-binding sensor domain-containing protein